MRSSSSLRTSLLAGALAAGVATAAPPERVAITYEVSREGTPVADIVDRFERLDGRYRVVETWKGRGLYSLAGQIVRSSYGTLGPAGPRPLEFADERSRRSPARAKFHWDAGKLTLHKKGETRSEALPADAQDRVSFLLALAYAAPRGASFAVVDGGGVSRYVFDAAGSERIRVPAGEFEALKMTRRPEDAQDTRTTQVWLARELGWLPVRILLVDRDGARFDQQATSVAAP
jgi:hypothetical protein